MQQIQKTNIEKTSTEEAIAGASEKQTNDLGNYIKTYQHTQMQLYARSVKSVKNKINSEEGSTELLSKSVHRKLY